MKKSILIFCTVLATFSLTAFGYVNWIKPGQFQDKTGCKKVDSSQLDFEAPLENKTDPDFVYDVDSRFVTTISKENLHRAESIMDIIPPEGTEALEDYQKVLVAIVNKERKKFELGASEVLNEAQRDLFLSTDYSNDILIEADCQKRNAFTGILEYYHLVYYISIIPEQEAQYAGGPNALISYLKENSMKETSDITRDGLKPGKLSFTVSKDATIENVNLNTTCGYPIVDDTFVELVRQMPEKWTPAKNAQGENVDQEFVFFFGLMGC